MSELFTADPDFERDLSWVREFMTTQVWPLEVVDVEDKEFEVVLRALQAEVKERRLWAAHLPPELGGQGHGTGEARPPQRDHRNLLLGPVRLRLPGA